MYLEVGLLKENSLAVFNLKLVFTNLGEILSHSCLENHLMLEFWGHVEKKDVGVVKLFDLMKARVRVLWKDGVWLLLMFKINSGE